MLSAFIVILITAPLYALYWMKKTLVSAWIRACGCCHSRRFKSYDHNARGDPVKLGYIVPEVEKKLESPCTNVHLQEAADEITFYGVNSKSECLFVRIARGCNAEADAMLYLRLDNGKTYQLTETVNVQETVDGRTFSCGKLQMHFLSPMRRWRIFYCGMLKEIEKDEDSLNGEEVFVKFLFLWTASSDVYDLKLDTNPKEFAKTIAKSSWENPFIPPISKLAKALNFYAQSGILHGTVSVNNSSDYEMYLFGEKIRYLGMIADAIGAKFTTMLGTTPLFGLSFHLTETSLPSILNEDLCLKFGFSVQPDSQLRVAKDFDINIATASDGEEESDSFQLSFTAGQSYDVTGHTLNEPIIFYSNHGWRGFIKLQMVDFSIGNKNGKGFMLSGEVHDESKKPVQNDPDLSPPECIPLTIPFEDELSHFDQISGGKGSSLGKLTKLSQVERLFVVPKGIVVTTAAYDQFVTQEIKEAVRHLEDVIYGIVKEDAKSACEDVVKVVSDGPLPKSICVSIIQDLHTLFGDNLIERKFAVRSSATGEDSSSMSAAGQMESFLGVQGLTEIYAAMRKCWASQFRFIAIEYKRCRGQILNSPMAVVIQEMVASEVSGVMFTCDPVTNNPSYITIAATYGLGETVVSGALDTDSIVLRRMRNEEVHIENINIVAKTHKIMMNDAGGISTIETAEEARQMCCLTEEMSIRLGKVGLEIEKFFMSTRDIEWGILNDNIYILQSRPVTNSAAETEFELKHEFDAPIRSEIEYFTIANTGEVMPGACSPLGLELVLKYFANLFKRGIDYMGAPENPLTCPYYPSGLLAFYNRPFLPIADFLNRHGLDSSKTTAFMLSVFGRILDDPELFSFTRERVGPAPKQFLLKSWYYKLFYYRDLFFFDFVIGEVKKMLESFDLYFLETKTAKHTFGALMRCARDFETVGQAHILCSETSSEWNFYLFDVLCNANGSCDTNVFADFARLLATSTNVESANIPHAMQELAYQIEEDMKGVNFKNMAPEEAVDWLQHSEALSGQKFREFLERHGHRCIKESDMKSITWGMDPSSLVESLQTLVGIPPVERKNEDDNYAKLFSELTIPLTFATRCKLKFVLPQCRRGVRARENSKSLFIKAFDFWRQGLRHLSDLMVAEGYIPDQELIFFFTLDEIKEVLEKRVPGIISKAGSRRKLFQQLDDFIFDEITKGFPRPVNDDSLENIEYVSDLTMTGTPVSQGTVKGYARVARTIQEAPSLQPGEILIAYSTDIGWSPYFPMLAGVVTEIGGLISHGAVVSREYGLPCIVGIKGATKSFQTGDYVLLDGKKGILQKLPKPEED